MSKTRQIAARTAAALLVVGGLIAVAAAPGDSQTVEVGATRGDAYGILLDLTSDLGDEEIDTLPIGDILEAANAGNQEEVASLIASTGIDFEAAAATPNPEAVAVTVGPIPFVTQPPDGSGGLFTDSLADYSLLGLLGFELAEVATEGVLGPDGFSASTADIENYFLDGIAGASAINVACDADLDGVSGATALVDGGSILGPFPETPGPNTNYIDIDVSFLGINIVFNVTLNEQFSDPDDIEVNGIHTLLSITIDTDSGPFNLITIDKIMAHTSCGIDPIEIPPPGPQPVPVRPSFAG
jgi:hypothetical protein